MEPAHNKEFNRFALRALKADWKEFSRIYGHLGLTKRRFEAMKVEELRAWLFKKAGVSYEGPNYGNPGVYVRLPEPLHDFVAENGGAAFLRRLVESAAQGSLPATALLGWNQVRSQVEGATCWRRGGASWVYLPGEEKPTAETEGYRTEVDARFAFRPPTLAQLVTQHHAPAAPLMSFEKRMGGQYFGRR